MLPVTLLALNITNFIYSYNFIFILLYERKLK